jgi:hypothetical protein
VGAKLALHQLREASYLLALKLQTLHFDPNPINLTGTILSSSPHFICLQKSEQFSDPFFSLSSPQPEYEPL